MVIVGMEKPVPSRRAASALLPAIATASTRLNPPHRLKMYAAHEAGAENRCLDLLHRSCLSLAVTQRQLVDSKNRFKLGPPRSTWLFADDDSV